MRSASVKLQNGSAGHTHDYLGPGFDNVSAGTDLAQYISLSMKVISM